MLERGDWLRNPMRQDCSECQRLWREYAAATTTHIGLESKLRGLGRASTAARTLSDDVATAANVRTAARRAIHTHEAELHGESADSAKGES
jgi:hypothetical protein